MTEADADLVHTVNKMLELAKGLAIGPIPLNPQQTEAHWHLVLWRGFRAWQINLDELYNAWDPSNVLLSCLRLIILRTMQLD